MKIKLAEFIPLSHCSFFGSDILRSEQASYIQILTTGKQVISACYYLQDNNVLFSSRERLRCVCFFLFSHIENQPFKICGQEDHLQVTLTHFTQNCFQNRNIILVPQNEIIDHLYSKPTNNPLHSQLSLVQMISSSLISQLKNILIEKMQRDFICVISDEQLQIYIQKCVKNRWHHRQGDFS